MRGIVAALVIAVALVSVPVGASPPAPAPDDVLGFVPGDDRKLADYASIVDYFRRLDAASDRVRLTEIGRTTLGRPMLLAVVSSPRNLARLDRIREVQRKLADPRGLTEAQTRALAAEGRAVVLVTFGIHSTEVGSTLSSTLVAHRLATDSSPETREILDNCVVLLVPSLNPDGVDIVKRWYDASLGQAWEGTSPPELYHHYVGHDNNRDWYAFTQIETRLVVDRVHNVWRPHVVNDVHQQGAFGSRLFLPPYLDPIEPNVPSEIVAGANALGTAAAWSLTSAGYPGVVTNAIYDAWTPARAYSHYHGGIRILSETASARLATPIEVRPEDLRAGRGYDSRRASANFPAPWRGGSWGLSNIVDYMTASTRAVLLASARNRERLLDGFARIGRDAVSRAPGEPFAFVIPPEPAYLTGGPVRPIARDLLLGTLARGGVEVRVARAPFRVGEREFPAGSAVVAYDQPYGGFAKALLERQQYPDLRATPGGPPVTPYDVTAHTLSLLMGYEAVRVDERFELPAGDRHPVPPADAKPSAPVGRTLKVGLYGGATAPMDEGWTRWYFDQLGVDHERLDEREIKKGRLSDRVDVIVLPDMSPRSLSAGRAAGTAPADMAGGLDEAGRRALELFVEEGGTLVTLNSASVYAIDALGLPVRDALSGVARTEFYGPGSILGLDVDVAHPLTAGVAARTVGWFENGPALEVREGAEGVRVVARFAPEERLLQSGWLLGGARIAGRPAIVEISRGRGRVVLFAFRPQYRGQSWATLPFLLNALAPHPTASAIGSDGGTHHQSRPR